MKLKNRLQIPLMVAETIITLSLFVLYAGASHRLRIPMGTVIVLAILSLLSVHVILSLWYAMAFKMHTSSHGVEVKMTAFPPGSQAYYNPNEVTVHVGERVTFINDDIVPHTATSGLALSDPSSGKIFDTDIIKDGQSSAPQQLQGIKVGDIIPYYCKIHPFMKGIIDVQK
jgi:plastocyanin